MDAIREGDKPSFDRLFVKYYPPLCAYAHRFVTPDRGDEIVHVLMLGLWEKRRDIRLTSSLGAYLFASVRNRCLTALSSARRRNRILEFVCQKTQQESENPEYYDIERLNRDIEHALAKLPDEQRRAFEMNRFEDKSYGAIAEELGVSIQTVAYRIGQSLRILRRELKDHLSILLLLGI